MGKNCPFETMLLEMISNAKTFCNHLLKKIFKLPIKIVWATNHNW